MNFWLMKSEPSTFALDDLQHRPRQTEPWDGVRNYQARNMMRDQMQVGDQAFFYHSNCPIPGIVGVMEIVRAGYPDHTAFDPQSSYFDARSDPENPRWFMVDVHYLRHTTRLISLAELKTHQELTELPLVRRGNRLSIMPVSKAQWHFILDLEQEPSET